MSCLSQVLIDRCNAWPECKAVVFGPLGWGKYSFPFGELKGTVGDPGAKLDPKRGNLNPVTYTLVKTSALPVEESSSGGLSTGAVAGGQCRRAHEELRACDEFVQGSWGWRDHMSAHAAR